MALSSSISRRDNSFKAAIAALVDPDTGEARAFHMELGAGASVVRETLVTNADRKSTLVTDESKLCGKVGKEFSGHQTVIHSGNNYKNKKISRRTTSKTSLAYSNAECAERTRSAANSTCSVI
jgi:hypothetical protein